MASPSESSAAVGPAGTLSDRSVLLVAYKIRAATGSEDGSGYHIAAELIGRGCRLTIITRANNAAELAADPLFAAATLVGVDVPRWLTPFKRGARGIILYYYMWQVVVGLRARRLAAAQPFDVVHQLNFHTDWAPHFLWPLGLPSVWGPIGHHRVAPRRFFAPRAYRELAKEVVRALVKRAFWHCDPFLRVAARRTGVILYANDDVAAPFRRRRGEIVLRPYAGSFADPERRATGPGDGAFRVIWVGRLVPLKGVLPAIEAFAAFASGFGEKRDVEMVIAGTGPLADDARRLAQSLGVLENIRFLGRLPQRELSSVYESGSVFLFPSVEAQGLVVAEALASGLPVIALEGTGPAFLAGPAGWIVGRRDHVTHLAEALCEAYDLWVDGTLEVKSTEAQDRYASYLAWPRIADAILEAYDDARTRRREEAEARDADS